MEITPIFASFLVKEKLGLDTKKIQKWIDKQKPDCEEKIVLNFSEAELDPLYSMVNEKLNTLHAYLGFKDNTYQHMYEAWINKSTDKRIQAPHTHPRANYICVYYPHVVGNPGFLEITNPNNALEYNYPQSHDNSIIGEYNVFNSQLWRVKPEEDLLVIIPAWLQHYVGPCSDNSERISIAINSRILVS